MSSAISLMLGEIKKIENNSFAFGEAKSYRQLQQQEQRLEKEKQNRIREVLLRQLVIKGINEGVTAFERALSSERFYHKILSACKENTIEAITLQSFSASMQGQLKKAGITNDTGLQSSLIAFQQLYDECAENMDFTDISLYQKVSKARLRQGGDISFSTMEQILTMMDYLPNINSCDTILEPSAGIGFIADAIKEYTPHIDCVERDYDFREILALKGYNVVGSNFLEMTPERKYSLVLMNPPFSEEIKHIQHAYDFVADGGNLFTLCSPMLDKKTSKEYRDFREWLDMLDYSIYYNFPSFENNLTPLAIKIRKNVDDDL